MSPIAELEMRTVLYLTLGGLIIHVSIPLYGFVRVIKRFNKAVTSNLYIQTKVVTNRFAIICKTVRRVRVRVAICAVHMRQVLARILILPKSSKVVWPITCRYCTKSTNRGAVSEKVRSTENDHIHTEFDISMSLSLPHDTLMSIKIHREHTIWISALILQLNKVCFCSYAIE